MREGPTARSDRPLFIAVIGLSSFLLFVLELLTGRLVLPVFGGAPAVWTTALCFFSAIVFAGYLYAHVVATRLPGRIGGAVHLLVAVAVVAATAFAPADVAALRVPGLAPALNVLLVLLLLAGAPAFLLSTTTPLLSAWFSRTGRDPWWLYAVSNGASLAGLLAYPLLVEPFVPLSVQRAGVLAALVLLAAALVAVVVRGREAPAPAAAPSPVAAVAPAAVQAPPRPVAPAPVTPRRPSARRQALWLLAAFVPAGLLSALSTHLATDHISSPLLWIGPLGVYLASFVVAFSARGRTWLPTVERLAPAGATLMWLTFVARVSFPPVVLLPVLLGSFAVVSVAVHGRLALDRPGESQLTRFYVLMSGGGLAATTFVALLAPLAFNDVYEYPLLVVGGLVALALLPGAAKPSRAKTLPAALKETGIRLAPYVIVASLLVAGAARASAGAGIFVGVVALIGALVIAVGRSGWALAAGTALAIVVLATVFSPNPLVRVRTFFGVTEVRSALSGAARQEIHGTTLHGVQFLDGRRAEPTSYFTRTGPLGDVFRDVGERATGGATIGIAGLGVGTLAAYARSSDAMTFFEIDPAIARLASDTRYFTYLADAPTRPSVVLGDGRLSLAAAAPETFDLLVLDAFSSDAVPAHLLTREAMRVYVRALRPHGLIAFNMTNRYFDLVPAVASTARSVGLDARALDGTPPAVDRETLAAAPSRWLVVGAPEDVARFDARGWRSPASGPVLTDDFSDVMWMLRAW